VSIGLKHHPIRWIIDDLRDILNSLLPVAKRNGEECRMLSMLIGTVTTGINKDTRNVMTDEPIDFGYSHYHQRLQLHVGGYDTLLF